MYTTRLCSFSCYSICLILCFTIIIYAGRHDLDDYPTANISSSWFNNNSISPSYGPYSKGSFRIILNKRTIFGLPEGYFSSFACGFICTGSNCESYLFAIYIILTYPDGSDSNLSKNPYFPQVVWSANRNNLVGINATLRLTMDGDLVLRDSDGSLVWSTNTAGKNVAGLNMTNEGNLVLFDENGSTVWQSFDHPTDSLVLGQKLFKGNKLTANINSTTYSEGMFTLFPTDDGLFASIESNPPQNYYTHSYDYPKRNIEPSYVRFLNGSLSTFIRTAEPNDPDDLLSIPEASSVQYMKLESDGHLSVYGWETNEWKVVVDLLSNYLDKCNYPMVCGKNGICSNGQCTCPNSTYFRQVNDRQPNLGCNEIVSLSCNSSQFHTFVELDDITYFTLDTWERNIVNLTFRSKDFESCKEACLRNCSCKAAIFHYPTESSSGDCYLPSEIFSFMNNNKDVTQDNSKAFVKVQMVPNSSLTAKKTTKKKIRLGIIFGPVGVFFVLFFIVGFAIFMLKTSKSDAEEEYLNQVPGLPTRFSYEELKVATNNFNMKLGQGGFGAVFKGTLEDGTQVAVKCLEGLTHVKKSFIAEVETIGSIHHVNLVRLIGFCVEKSHGWILVYEYVSNGSLDQWIFHKNEEETYLDWKCKKNIILDIAKGLTYLHEDCRQKIIHLDIKPQNILLDDEFNAKVADFGLSKLVDRNQSQVVTTMRGTPGYLAPEWLNSVITEKVDVYSFGVVVLEICCGRKNIDRSLPEEEMHLIRVFQDKMEDGNLLDMVNSHCEDVPLNEVEVVEMMRLAAWCLQNDFAKRPSMSMVVKVLEGFTEVEENLDFRFLNPLAKPHQIPNPCNTHLLASILSGPR